MLDLNISEQRSLIGLDLPVYSVIQNFTKDDIKKREQRLDVKNRNKNFNEIIN